MDELSLAKIDAVRVALEQAATVQEIKNVIDMTAAAKTYARQIKSGTEIRLKLDEYNANAERKLGEMLKAAKAAGQITHEHGNQHKAGRVVVDDDNPKVKLSDAGISRDLSSRAQKLADIPKEQFDQQVAEQKARGKVSTKAIVNAANVKTAKSPKVPNPHKLEAQILAMRDSGKSRPKIAEELGTTARNVREIEETGRLRQGGERIVSAELSLTAQQKLEAIIKQEKKKLAQEFEATVAAEVDRRVRRYMEIASEKLAAEREEHRRVMEGRKGFMTKQVYRDIRACLHPDRGTHPERFTASKLQDLYSYAFHEFSKLEKCILDEKESPTPRSPSLPRTMAEWEAMRRKVAADKKAARNNPRSVTKK